MKSDEEAEIVVEVKWPTLVVAVAVMTFLAVAWASGVFYDLLFLLPHLQPVELTLVESSNTLSCTVDLKVCIAEWVKEEELSLIIISPEGKLLYSSRIRKGSDNCMAVSLKLGDVIEGTYTAAVVRRNTALHVAHFKLMGNCRF